MHFIGWLETASKDGYYEYAGGACDPALEVKGVRNENCSARMAGAKSALPGSEDVPITKYKNLWLGQ